MLPKPCQPISRPSAACSRRQIGDGDLHAALHALHAIGEASQDAAAFARHGVQTLAQLVDSELTTLSDCDLRSGHRCVVTDVPGAISPRELAIFDHYLNEHPLINAHRQPGQAITKRVSDVLPTAKFQRGALFNEYYRRISIEHVMAVPIRVERGRLVGFVFNRRGRDFTARDCACLETIRPHLGDLYRLCAAFEQAPSASVPTLPLTAREREVLQWLAAGKTDKDIGSILGISPRTVHKHLQRIYEELGVETRTAAVMRALALEPHCRTPAPSALYSALQRASVTDAAGQATASA